VRRAHTFTSSRPERSGEPGPNCAPVRLGPGSASPSGMTAKGVMFLATLALAGCDVTMFKQAKAVPQAEAPSLPNQAEAQPPPAGTVAQGAVADQLAAATPSPATPALLARGRERYDIFCKPCHGVAGAGDGTIVQRGFPRPPDYVSAQVMTLSGAQIFGVITNGYGVMFPYGDRVAPNDRWAIVAYVRALQLARRSGGGA
jgi:mono/diheme cytochrome c family protein